MSADEEIRSIRESGLKRYYLKGYAAGLICRMYLIMILDMVKSPAAVRRYVKTEMPSLRKEIERKIDEEVLSERDRAILKRRVLDGIKLEPLAEEFELSERTVRTICNKYKRITE